MSEEQERELRHLSKRLSWYEATVSEIKKDMDIMKSDHLLEIANNELHALSRRKDNVEFRIYKIKKELGLIE